MQQQLINHSPDLKKLQDEGYDLEIIGGQYLLVHYIPFVNPEKQIKYGTLVCALTLASPTRTARPDHTVFFRGETPCESNGVPLIGIINNSHPQQLTTDILINHYFSSKPSCGYYEDYYHKVRTYAEILCAQARSIDNNVTSRPNRLKLV
jgi:hypothetical protein